MRSSGLLFALLLACGRGPPAPPTESSRASETRAASVRPTGVPSAQGPAPAPPPPPEAWPARVLTWDYATSAIGKTRVVTVSPETTEHLPVLIALHGLGEAEKGPERGARGWIDDYGLLTALDRLTHPPLTKEDMQGLGTAAHLARVNAELEANPYRGLIVVCPYTPNILGDRSLDGAEPLGRFLVEEVLPRVYRELPAIGTPETTGIDGVSLGGRAALLVGFEHAERFGAVGSLQAAIYDPELRELGERAAAARQKNGALELRLVTSSADFYLATLRRWSRELERAGVVHDLEVIDRGPHSYAFNRGLGAYAMLLFHDRALRR